MSVLGDIYTSQLSSVIVFRKKTKNGVLGRLFHVFRANMDSDNSSSTLSTQLTLADTMAEKQI